jgi:hypothetical protein
MNKYLIFVLFLAQSSKILVEALVNRRQQATAYVTTCGYVTGDPNQPRVANSGFDCRVDTLNALWGFCPTTVIAVTDCGLAGNCVDAQSCSQGCGIVGTIGITTFTW